MKLQISLDLTDLQKALELAAQVEEYADILEVGSLLVFNNGVNAVYEFKKQFSHKKILADAKLVDRVKDAVPLFCKNAADYITVLAGTNNKTIEKAASLAHSYDTYVMLDLIDAYSMGQSAQDAKVLDVDIILFHKSQEATESGELFAEWETVKGNTDLPIYISGHINKDNIEQVLSLKPDGLVIGSGITKADDPAEAAKFFRDLMGG